MAYSSDQIFQRLQEDPVNRQCVDCEKKGARWSSVTYGTFLCGECIGPHRNLGTDLSYVKSLTLDCWAERHLSLMCAGGNRQFSEFMNHYNLMRAPFTTRYRSKAAQYYRLRLKALVQDSQPPSNPPASRAIMSKRLFLACSHLCRVCDHLLNRPLRNVSLKKAKGLHRRVQLAIWLLEHFLHQEKNQES